MMLVDYERRGRVGYLALNRPERLNAFSEEMHRDYEEALKAFDLDDDAWVAILHGRGRAFSSGADVKTRQQKSEDELRRLGGTGGPYGRHILELTLRSVNSKPLIAAVHGYVLGSGLAAVLASDLVVADVGARFQVTEAQRGLATVAFLAAMGLRGLGASAIETCLTGRFFSAAEALEWDLINRVTEGNGHVAAAEELADQILQIPPLSVRASVRHRRNQMRRIVADARYEVEPMKLHLSEDFRASGQAFLRKGAAPDFKGR